VRTYGQYCPIARGAEIFAERWTPLIIRNLHLGCETFGEILEGAPGLSRTLLTQRLKQLERLGIIESAPKAQGLDRAGRAVRRLRLERAERGHDGVLAVVAWNRLHGDVGLSTRGGVLRSALGHRFSPWFLGVNGERRAGCRRSTFGGL
jgi:hypothetical protein